MSDTAFEDGSFLDERAVAEGERVVTDGANQRGDKPRLVVRHANDRPEGTVRPRP